MLAVSPRSLALALALVVVVGAPGAVVRAETESGAQGLAWDPWEPLNRRTFAFNETLDAWLLEPVATVWDFAVPHPVQRCFGNLFDHLVLPVRVANDLLQLKARKAIEDVFRFQANTLLGLGGCFDVATRGGITKHNEDFGQTLGHWGVPAGPYLVLPLLGPSNPRDGVGLLVDSTGAVQTFFISWPVLFGAAAFDIVNTRALSLEDLAAERASAFDFYAAVRSAYVQFRENRVYDRADAPAPPAAEQDEDLYYFDEDEELPDE